MKEKTKTVRIDKARLNSLINSHKKGRGWIYQQSGIKERTFARLIDLKSDNKVNIESVKSLSRVLEVPEDDFIINDEIDTSFVTLKKISSFAGHPTYSAKEAVHKYYNCNIDEDNSKCFKDLNEFIYKSTNPRKTRGNVKDLISGENEFIDSLSSANTALKTLRNQSIGMYVGEYYVFYIDSWVDGEPNYVERLDFDPEVDEEHERYDVKYTKYHCYYPAYEKIKVVAFFKSDADEIQIKVNKGYENRIETIKAYKEFIKINMDVKSIQNLHVNNIEKLYEAVDKFDIYDNQKGDISDISVMSNSQFTAYPNTKLIKNVEYDYTSVLRAKGVSIPDGEYKEVKKKEEPMK